MKAEQRRTALTPWDEFLIATAPLSEVNYQLVRQRLATILDAREMEIRRMLSLWVSELEPVAVYARDAYLQERLAGLTFKGVPIGAVAPIIIGAREGTP